MSAFLEAMDRWSVEWWNWMVPAAWQAGAAALLLLAVVALGRRWPAPLRSGLLFLALLKFALPPTWTLPTGVFGRIGPALGAERKPGAELHAADRGDADPLGSRLISMRR